MAEGIETFDEKRNLDRVKAGFKGGMFFQNGVKAPDRTFVKGYPSEVYSVAGDQSFPQPTPTDPWVNRK